MVYELDQPRVLEFKRDTVDQLGEEPAAERREVAIDRARRLAAGPAGKRLRPVAAVGVDRRGIVDLSACQRAQEKLFAGIDALAAPGQL